MVELTVTLSCFPWATVFVGLNQRGALFFDKSIRL